MGDIVSLKLVRKQKAREERDKSAAENRARFGKSKSDRKLDEARGEKAARDLDGHKRDT